MVAYVGPLATRDREPGQARKGAAVAVKACAGVWLALAAALMTILDRAKDSETMSKIPGINLERFATAP